MGRLRKSEKYIVKLTKGESFTSTFKALVGIGILSSPFAYKDVGLVGGIVGTILVITVVNIMYNQMVKVIEKVSTTTHRSLGEITDKVYGHRMKTLVELSILGC